jgi:TRAP-type C4-dicarboxylate transport system permease small subunit
MKMKFEHMVATVVIGILGWGSLQLYQMNANMSVIAYKVDENYKMIKPMWQDYLVRTVGLRQVKSEQ